MLKFKLFKPSAKNSPQENSERFSIPFKFLSNLNNEKNPQENRIIWSKNLQNLKFKRENNQCSSDVSEKIKLIILNLPYRLDSSSIVNYRNNEFINSLKQENQGFFEKKVPHIFLKGVSSQLLYNSSLPEYFIFLKSIIEPLWSLLADDGFILIQYNGMHSHYVKILLDDILSYDNFLNEIFLSTPYTEKKNSEHVLDSTNVLGRIYVYAKKNHPSINPLFKNKLSGGYWHTMHSKGAGLPKKFRINGKIYKLDPPIGSHWKYSQQSIDNMCLSGKIKLNSKGKPLYWVEKKQGYILDNIWLDIPAFKLGFFGWELNSQIFERMIRSFSNEGDTVCQFLVFSGIGAKCCIKLNRNYIGFDDNLISLSLLLENCAHQQNKIIEIHKIHKINKKNIEMNSDCDFVLYPEKKIMDFIHEDPVPLINSLPKHFPSVSSKSLHYAWKIFHENILPLFSPNDQKYFHKLFCFSLTNLKAQFIPQGVQNSQDFPVKLAINRNQLNDSHFLLDLSETYTFAYTDNNPPIDVKERDSLNFQADQDKNWRNQLFCGDNRDILNILKSQYLNQIQLIYIDPPFYTGTNEYMDVSLRGSGGYFQEHPTQILKTMAYKNVIVNSDHINTFSTWLYERINLMHKLLQQKGFLALRFDYHYGHYAKTILDDIFGESNYINEYLIRRMHKNVSKKSLHLQQRLIVQNDSLFLYRKTPAAQFQEIVNKKKRTNQNPSEIESNTNNNWMDIVGYEKSKKTLYPTENSRHLLSRIIQLCSSPNDLIADFFAGSGTTLTVAQSLNRNWIGADIGEKSIHEIRKRLVNQLSVNHPPFQLFYLNPLIESQSKKSSIQPHQKTIQLKLHQTSKTKHYSTFGFFNHSKKPFLEFIVKKFNQSKTLIIEFVRYNYLDHSNILDNDLSLDNSLSLIDFWAIDWNFKKSAHFFAQDIYFQKIGQGRKIINQTEKRCQHIYPISGSYQILIKTKDIFGYEINHFFTFSFLQ